MPKMGGFSFSSVPRPRAPLDPNITVLEVHLVFGKLLVYNAHVPIDDQQQ